MSDPNIEYIEILSEDPRSRGFRIEEGRDDMGRSGLYVIHPGLSGRPSGPFDNLVDAWREAERIVAFWDSLDKIERVPKPE